MVCPQSIKMISAWLVILIASIVIAISLKPAFSEDMSIPDTPSEKAMDIIQKEFSKGPDKGSIRVIFGAEDGKKLTSKPEKQAIEETLKKIKTDHSVASIASPLRQEPFLRTDQWRMPMCRTKSGR